MKMPLMSLTSRLAAAAVAAALAGGATLATTAPASADRVTPAQLTGAGRTCIRPHLFPALKLCAPPGTGLPPLVGIAGFADRAPSYELLVFEFATGAFLGTELLLRPDIYQQGLRPPPGGPARSL
jgi:hypothetical protein